MAESMKQPKTDYGEKGETGEREPKGAKASDRGGERKERLVNGVGMGKMDDTDGRKAGGKDLGEYNTGRSESVCYSHARRAYHGEDRSEGQKE